MPSGTPKIVGQIILRLEGYGLMIVVEIGVHASVGNLANVQS